LTIDNCFCVADVLHINMLAQEGEYILFFFWACPPRSEGRRRAFTRFEKQAGSAYYRLATLGVVPQKRRDNPGAWKAAPPSVRL